MDFINTFSTYCSLYTLAKNLLPEPYSSKARVIVSGTNSLLLSVLSFITFRNFQLHPVRYFLDLPQHTWIANYTMGYFAADLFLGHFYDRKNLNFLTGYVHHLVFIGMVYHVKITNQINLIYMLVPFEIPTFFLDISRVHKHPYVDLAFGFTFFTFRILYNVYIIQKMWIYYPPYSLITSLLLTIHTFWFQQWTRKMLNQNQGQ